MQGMENGKHFNSHRSVRWLRSSFFLFLFFYLLLLISIYLSLAFTPFFCFSPSPCFLTFCSTLIFCKHVDKTSLKSLHNEEVAIEKIFVSQLLPLHIPPANHLYSNVAVNTLFYEEYVLGLRY
jgi:hypothetical protein